MAETEHSCSAKGEQFQVFGKPKTKKDQRVRETNPQRRVDRMVRPTHEAPELMQEYEAETERRMQEVEQKRDADTWIAIASAPVKAAGEPVGRDPVRRY